uniref:Uncharacterized protein n=1 Tax=Apiotrichum gracile TaxID=82516 RepID=A0A8K1ZR47_9TREE|nr:hypothetical protein [Apiotrichum gracile]
MNNNFTNSHLQPLDTYIPQVGVCITSTDYNVVTKSDNALSLEQMDDIILGSSLDQSQSEFILNTVSVDSNLVPLSNPVHLSNDTKSFYLSHSILTNDRYSNKFIPFSPLKLSKTFCKPINSRSFSTSPG